jgi:hypothetical protein
LDNQPQDWSKPLVLNLGYTEAPLTGCFLLSTLDTHILWYTNGMKILQFSHGEAMFDVTYNKGYVAYSFSYNGTPYGNKVKPQSRKMIDIIGASFLLASNAIQTYEDIRLREGTPEDGPTTDDSEEPK